MSTTPYAQYLWKNRLIMITINRLDHPLYKQFLLDFAHYRQQAIQRRLLYKTQFNPQLKKDQSFQLTLYSIDGTVLKRSNNYQTLQELFKLIDLTPSRRAEFKQQKCLIKK